MTLPTRKLMTNQTKQITEYNLYTFIVAILAAAEAGWKIDEKNPPAFYGYMYEVVMVRDATDEQIAADKAELEKLTRPEILAKARKAKAEKKAAEEAQSE